MNLSIAMVAAVALWVTAAEPGAKANLKDAHGQSVGEATLEQTAHGLVIKGTLRGLTPGVHALHVHQVGKCEAPFKSAGDHFNPQGHAHGVRAENGAHAGDLPNVVIPPSGELTFELFAPGLTLTGGADAVLDADGSALVVHAKADDYVSQPAGNAGDRIACGVIEKAGR